MQSCSQAHRYVVLPIARSLSEDNSWRVRLAMAERIDILMKALGNTAARTDLADSYEQLLSDIEVGFWI